MERKLVAAIACRNQGSRLYAKPIQNLNVQNGIRIIDNIISCLRTLKSIDEIVLGISEGLENEIFKRIANEKNIRFITGDENDVLSRLIQAGEIVGATDIFRITSESPFLFFEKVEEAWEIHKLENSDATFMDGIIDGCGFEIISLQALRVSHEKGESKHRSELCTLYIRENHSKFKITKLNPPKELVRTDLRLTVDNPEDLSLCRTIYSHFQELVPRIPISEIVKFLDTNPKLKELVYQFTEIGYSTMYL
ncbi:MULTISPECIES: cytidylyltransferase domain-containing protein [Leptospira]|uniref:Cytidylyltransferase n=6 Tax=Leptospira TaxID=171 RepID=M3I470_LEPIR|nr:MULTISPECIES: acylneuraminate cytidylyltransferase [Leptospira]ADC94029.1 spore coat polysaccharide biosynthesis protein spsF-like protein [Leptospira interrogans serovar Grippotyphosa]EMF70766.1 hypothetical protein LEP1GSC148_4701 [Leptospira interrogans serovar Canicola str. LT1962]EMG10667.1 hypothetical protein LEP1GSC151_0421 [Leptospira interrogans serovar Grippotyphosa str. LT2186]KAA1266722.1 acylneuraminate cytidylyltransferase [Leptospira interrogans serovar Weerasinghe]AJR14902.